MKIIKNLSPGGDEGSGASATPDAKPFASFSAEMEVELQEETPTAAQETPTESAEEVLAAQNKAIEEAAAAKLAAESGAGVAAKEPTPEEKLASEKTAAEEETRIVGLVEKLSPEQKVKYEAGEIDAEGKDIVIDFNAPAQVGTNDDGETSWIDVAKELGWEAKEDTVEGLKAAQLEFVNKTKAEIESADIEKRTAHLPVESQVTIRALNAGLTLDQINAPAIELNNQQNYVKSLLTLDNTELVRNDLKLKDLPEDVIDYQITKLIADGNIDKEAAPLRKFLETKATELETQKAGLAAAQLSDIKELELSLQNKKQQELTAHYKTLREIATKSDIFMGQKIAPTVSQKVLDKYEKGEYQDVLTDPTKLFKALMFLEYGDVALASATKRAVENLQKSRKNELHNIPIIKERGGSASQVAQTTKEEGPFSSFAKAEGLSV